MKKYLDIALENNIFEAYLCYGSYYNENSKIISMYNKAIEKNITKGYYYLANHYSYRKNYDAKIKMLIKGVEKGDDDCIIELSEYYISSEDVTKYYFCYPKWVLNY